MADALVAPAVATIAGVSAATLIAVSARKIKKIKREDIVPLMGVMGAFIFAAQMINFTIPGTGSSGHIVGGILLAAVLGPWAAFLTLSSVLIIQCLVFADGGIMALGCNIINMAATSCLIAYPLIFKPIVGSRNQIWRILLASVLSSTVALELGALGVTAETELSGITAIPTATFISFMLPIHLVIGAVEGIATGAALCFISKYSPQTLFNSETDKGLNERRKTKRVLVYICIATIVLAGGFTWIASSYPDGLEWSIENASGLTELSSTILPTAVLPDYDSTFAGIIGAMLVMILLWAITTIIFHNLRRSTKRVENSEK